MCSVGTRDAGLGPAPVGCTADPPALNQNCAPGGFWASEISTFLCWSEVKGLGVGQQQGWQGISRLPGKRGSDHQMMDLFSAWSLGRGPEWQGRESARKGREIPAFLPRNPLWLCSMSIRSHHSPSGLWNDRALRHLYLVASSLTC